MERAATSIIAAVAAFASWGAAAAERPVAHVVELFTSQGCSSCPPANANLIRLRDRSDVLALSFAVTYWDQLGWKDTFGRGEYTARQETYEAPLGHDGPFTPQVVVNGRSDVVGDELASIEGLLQRGHLLDAPSITLEGGALRVGSGPAPKAGADVWVVRYDPSVRNVPVARGENAGRTLPHGNVVHALTRVGTWRGEPATYSVDTAEPGLRTAILVQTPHGGPILSAATD
jgi:hypothetical protein